MIPPGYNFIATSGLPSPGKHTPALDGALGNRLIRRCMPDVS